MHIDRNCLTATTPPGETDPMSGAYDDSVMTFGIDVNCYCSMMELLWKTSNKEMRRTSGGRMIGV